MVPLAHQSAHHQFEPPPKNEAKVIGAVLDSISDVLVTDLRRKVLPACRSEYFAWRRAQRKEQVRRWLLKMDGLPRAKQSEGLRFRIRSRKSVAFLHDDWSTGLRKMVHQCATDWSITLAGEPPEWWWDVTESALLDLLVHDRAHLGDFWSVDRARKQDPAPYLHTRGKRINDVPRAADWFAQIHLDGETAEAVADEDSDAPEPDQVNRTYLNVCKILRIDPRLNLTKQ